MVDLLSEGGRDSVWSKWAGQFRNWRIGRVLDPAFHRFATQFWFTRPIVRKRQKELFDLTAGFVYSQILYAAVELGLFQHLAKGALPLDVLSARLGLDESATKRLVDGAEAVKLVTHSDGVVRLADLGAALVANPGIAAMIRHHAMFYRDLADPVALLKGEVETTELSEFWGYATSKKPGTLNRERVDDYSALMAISQRMVVDEVIATYPFQRHGTLLDVGGGEGAFVSAVGDAFPDLHLSTFDLPAVSERAREKMAAGPLAGRYRAYAGSFFDDPLPRGADLISLIRVIYDHDDEKVLKILRAVHAALPKDGTLLVAEPMAKTPGAETMGGAYFGFYLMAMQSGSSRSADEIANLMQIAGFKNIKTHPVRSPILTSVLSASV